MTPEQEKEFNFYTEEVPKKQREAHELFLKYSEAQLAASRIANEYARFFTNVIINEIEKT